MWNVRHLLALPPALLALLLTSQTAYAIDATDSQALWRRDIEAQARLSHEQPHGVRKMSSDPSEKFWFHYWEFAEELASSVNASMPAEQPIRLHLATSSSLFGRSIFGRDGTCPANTNACTSIGAPNSCCPGGSTCINVQDTGNGNVGCCAAGQTCGNTISGCDTSQGYSSCPNSSNKGCCIPGYQCSGDICVNAATQTVTPQPTTTSTTTITSTSSTSSSSASSASPSVVTVVSVNTSGFTTTATVTTTVTPSSSFTSSSILSSSSSSASAEAPVRPTSSSSVVTVVPATVSSSSTTTITTTTTAQGSCPTGFYACSAVYLGGCCQVGRDCNTTDCPSTASTTVISGSPTVVAPAGNTANNFCASGWYSCAASLGGNCCPNGFNCASTTCIASVSGVPDQAKQTPSEGSILACISLMIGLSLASGLGMILL